MNIHVVLVRTEYARNIGATARAMANMGADRLILIDAKCEVDHEAKQMAAGAQETLSSAIHYPTWNDFYRSEGDGLRIALTRRTGRQRKVLPLEEALAQPPTEGPNIYLIFGPEADGLDNADMAFVHCACHLPVYGDFASLNLSQAVLLALFMTRQKFPPQRMPAQLKGESAAAVQPFYFPDEILREWLTAMGFDIRARRSSAYLTLRRVLLCNRPTRHEVQVLEAILRQNVRRLRGEKESVGLTAEELADDLGDVGVEDV
jgi:tRNA/rRNA methyltransferase